MHLPKKKAVNGILGRGVTVREDVFRDLRLGRRDYIVKEYDEWNAEKFLTTPVSHLYVARRTDPMGECLRLRVTGVRVIHLENRFQNGDYIKMSVVRENTL